MVCFDIKKVAIFIFAILVFISCGSNKKEVNKAEMAGAYIEGLNTSNYTQVVELFLDSVRFNEMDYVRTFSKEGYQDLFQWDSVFKPEYEMLEMKEENGELHLKVLKKCERILFLQNKPFITHEVMKFKEGAIHSIDIVEYVDFNDSLWAGNREKLVNWISEYHPELNGFIHDQTKVGALNFKKAIELYRNRNNVVPGQENINQ
ncbi:MAG: hypothetical protein GYB37_02775 [Algicola sp.]|nr:hypothetical protein [Algicola sp.]